MRSPETARPLEASILLFSSQALSIREASLNELRASINTPSFSWALRALTQLPHWWSPLQDAFPHLKILQGQQLLQDLAEWSTTGSQLAIKEPLPNLILTPLVVLGQLIRYQHHQSDIKDRRESHPSLLAHYAQSTEAVGFCTGLLSAYVVAGSPNASAFERHASRAICLAMFIGAFVDAQDQLKGQSTSFAVYWTSSDGRKTLSSILEAFPDAYVPVSFDEKRVTVTCSASNAFDLLSCLHSAGLSATEIGLRGRFHSHKVHIQLEALISFCASHTRVRLPNTSELLFPVWSKPQSPEKGHHNVEDLAIHAILGNHCDWYATFKAAFASRIHNNTIKAFCFGPEKCIPPSFKASLNSRYLEIHSMTVPTTAGLIRSTTPITNGPSLQDCPDDSIAVIGMSVKVAGADDLDEFWELLCRGESQHIEVPNDRFDFETPWRSSNADRKWYGNFMKDHDTFDHKFFRKSPREIAATDPQQRLVLQAAYQAVQQSGYFGNVQDKHIGCYVGVGTVDYERNIGCHAPNAFSATGNLKSFVAGKVSHYFGWTGPALTIDTACSASAVAIHTACKAILHGECTTALAGGVMFMSSPEWFQNLAGASFLSPTGACKPFDANADGYCRGEGVGIVYLKSLRQAIRDGDQVLGSIASTAVYQNENSTPITVPNSVSLSGLFSHVTEKAHLRPEQISYVEAHGTGTPVGDPAEYESIRKVFGDIQRSESLSVGSVKGLVGHTECASGVVSLIKILLMVNKGVIPPQASFKTLNPSIYTTPMDKMEINTRSRSWDSELRAVLLNNYGASGSNASMIVTETGLMAQRRKIVHQLPQGEVKIPVWLSAFDDRSLRAYATKLRHYIESHQSDEDLSLQNLSFNLARQSNRNLNRSLIFTARSHKELSSKLSSFESGEETSNVTTKSNPRPVILCFGGQTSTFVGLDPQLYSQVQLLRHHLDECDDIYQARGLTSIYPGIFQRSTIEDTVLLQAMLFANQYACAMCWIRSGIQPAALVGHSFGELTALCVSGCLSLEDAIDMIISRATLVRDSWGPERGSMIAIEGDIDIVRQLIEEVRLASNDSHGPQIACYNGPTSFTIAGSVSSIDDLEAKKSMSPKYTSVLRTKRLNVSHAFHSSMVDSILVDLQACGKKLSFRDPKIALEFSKETAISDGRISSLFVAEHMRSPVFFHLAVDRLAKQYPSSVWLEAGSRSTITNMARKALGVAGDGSHFQSVDITSDNAYDLLAETTACLWKQGLDVTFWPHHNTQATSYSNLILPPYQFDRTKHWMELKKPANIQVAKEPVTSEPVKPPLFTFVGYEDSKDQCALFKINTDSELFRSYVSGHTIAQAAPLCPSTLQLDIAIEALMHIRPDYAKASLLPQLHNLQNHAPMCLDQTRTAWLKLECSTLQPHDWEWKMMSNEAQNTASTTLHVSGKLLFRPANNAQWQNEFFKYERLVNHERCRSLLGRTDLTDTIHGRHIYKVFSDIVDYGEVYQGLQKIVGNDHESAGQIRMAYTGKTWLDTPLWDSFCQVAGIYVNCMTDNQSAETMFISTGIQQWIRSPKLGRGTARAETSDVLACHHRVSEKQYLSDIFVFSPRTGELLEAILGVSYSRVSKLSMRRMLTKLTKEIDHKPGSSTISKPVQNDTSAEIDLRTDNPILPQKQSSPKKAEPDISDKVKDLVARVSGLEPHEISSKTSFLDIGIDSLMGMELSREIEDVFSCKLDTAQLYEVVDMESLIRCVLLALGDVAGDKTQEHLSALIEDRMLSESDSEGSDDASQCTAATSTTTFNVCEYFAEQLGLEIEEVPMTAQLQQLGVDSLLGSELWNDLTSRFRIDLPTDATFLDLTVQDIYLKINIQSPLAPPEATEPALAFTTSLEPPVLGPTDCVDPSELSLRATSLLQAFEESKSLTDSFVEKYQMGGYANQVLPVQDALCVSLVVEAFDRLGCRLHDFREGEVVTRVSHLPEHRKLVDYLYDMLDKVAKLVAWDGKQAIRTATPLALKSSAEILEQLMHASPENGNDHRLTFHCGSRLADCLSGEASGVQLIFGSPDGRSLVSNLYGQSPINQVWLRQMEDFLTRLVSNLPAGHGPLKIMEMGAGTGGTTAGLARLCASLGVPIEYTFSDISGSLVAAARKRFKHLPFMRFRAYDIEKEPPAELLGTQHIVISNNCVHATHNLTKSTQNIRSVLRSDGFLMMVEMTSTLYWVDLIFGLLEGWWFFDDGRNHAVTHQDIWKSKLHAAGFGYVDWTCGQLPEASIQRILIALASAPEGQALNQSLVKSSPKTTTDLKERQRLVDEYVSRFSGAFTRPIRVQGQPVQGCSILITGATGSLGCYLVEHFAKLPQVQSVICMNRPNAKEAYLRQIDALKDRGITLESTAHSKIQVVEADITQPGFGVPSELLDTIVRKLTHIIHNAWPMSIKRPIKGFESQLRAMRNLVDLAHQAATCQPPSVKIGFQFISSIATVGHYPLHSRCATVPEEPVDVGSVLPSGYGDAKLVCEMLLCETLRKHPDTFGAMSVRLGQISGSTTSGYWNPVEHFPFMVKSSQTLNALPDLSGQLSWCPVNVVAATLGDLLLCNQPAQPIYHIENPSRQPWSEMISWMSEALHIPSSNVIPFGEWIRQVRELGDIPGNPAAKVVEFLEEHFPRMSCGGLILSTEKSRARSMELSSSTTVGKDILRKYITAWRDTNFLE